MCLRRTARPRTVAGAVDRIVAADSTAAGCTACVRGRTPLHRRRDARAVQHLSRRRSGPPSVVRAPTAPRRGCRAGEPAMNLDELNSLAAAAAIGEFLRCCGSGRWATAMTAARPFQTFDDVLSTADAIWTALDQPDWLEAFEAHPKIGETGTAGWSTREQAGVAAATTDVRD